MNTQLFYYYLMDTIPDGHYEFEMYAIDEADNMVIVPMELTVDKTNPVLSTPSDVTYTESLTGNSIDWTCSDVNPSHYELYRNGELVSYGSWTDGLDYSVDGLSVGTYTFTITFWDLAGNSVTDSVTVTVTDGSSTGTTSGTTSGTTTSGTGTTNTSEQSNIPLSSMMIGIVAAGSLVVILVVIVLIKRQK